MPALTVEKPLREKLGEDASESLLRLVNQSVEQRKHEMLEFVEEKFERRLTEEISKVNERITTESSKVNERLTEEIGKVNERMTEEIGKVNERITAENSKTRADLIKWMFIFWIGQVGALLGILFAFFK
ncbi:MAG: hypothetical protein U5R06_01550 [candidate division KSB1 bacterium]|nr:hypothetical protein [candidate division KSB1 bacterium]